MKYLLWTLMLFAAAAALVTASHNPGYVLLVYPPYRMEMSLVLFVVMLVFAFVFGYGLVRLTVAALQLPSYVRKFRLERAQKKAHVLLNDALNAFFEGRYAAAEKASSRAMGLGETSSLHPIIAAHSAHKLREYEKRDTYLAAAEGNGDATMRLITAAKFMLDQRDPRGALRILQELRDSGITGHPGALSLELKAQQQTGNWDEVLNLLDQLGKYGSIDEMAATHLRQQAWLKKISQQGNLAELMACLKNIPTDLKLRGKIAAAAARELIRHGVSQPALPPQGGRRSVPDAVTLAQQLLSDSLNAQWDSDLVALYGDCPSEDVIAQIKQAEKWLNQHSNDAGLLLALGKLCMYQKLWGKAQNYLDASISVSPSHAAFHALGQLAEQSGKAGEAPRYYQQAAALKASGS